VAIRKNFLKDIPNPQRLQENIHKGKVFDIVGSGMTALEFRPNPEHISMGTNRSCLLAPYLGLENPIFDYEILYDYITAGDDTWYEKGSARQLIVDQALINPKRGRRAINTYQSDSPIVIKVRKRGDMPEIITTSQFYRRGGSISIAMQCACLMGASQIDLYGCTWTEGPENYIYFTGETYGKKYRLQQSRIRTIAQKLISQFGVKIRAKEPNYLVNIGLAESF